MNKEQVIAQVLEAFFNLINIEEIKSVEENCGTIWIEKTDGTTASLSLINCENKPIQASCKDHRTDPSFFDDLNQYDWWTVAVNGEK